jgi:hypothetical protein
MLIFFATLLDTILRVMKNILVNRSSKFFASFINALLYLCNALLIKYIATTDTLYGLLIVIPTSFIGCWLAMSIIDYLQKIKKG